MSLLNITNLEVTFCRPRVPDIRAVKGLSFTVGAGETLGIVGESGSGKSVSSLAILGLLPSTARVAGDIRFAGQSMLGLKERDLRKIRGQDIGMIFQDPMTSLNPYLRVGYQLSESLIVHKGLNKRRVKEIAIETMTRVGIADASRRYVQYPHEFSGGMRQRVMIAMALMTKPKLLIADEPTTALDVTTQRQILAMIRKIQHEDGMSVIFISHDLAVVSAIADRCLVMYAGEMMEEGPLPGMLRSPKHPYAKALLAARPSTSMITRSSRGRSSTQRLLAIDGAPPSPQERIDGCPFAPRCDVAAEKCGAQKPNINPVSHRLTTDTSVEESDNVESSQGYVRCWNHA